MDMGMIMGMDTGMTMDTGMIMDTGTIMNTKSLEMYQTQLLAMHRAGTH